MTILCAALLLLQIYLLQLHISMTLLCSYSYDHILHHIEYI